jgi:acyl-CoA thioester hydrolase
MSTELFPYPIDIQIQWGEMDALNHVNNVMFIRYFETARVHMMTESGLWGSYEETGMMVVLAKVECNFIQPLYFPDVITAQARIKSIGKSSMVVEHEIISKKSGLAAKGDGIIVFVDPNTGKSTPISDEIRDKINEAMGL